MASKKGKGEDVVNKSDDKPNKSDNKCGCCSKKVSSNDDGVQCEICSAWFHCKCQNISSAMYDALGQFSHDFHWFCNGCKDSAENILSIISSLQNKVKLLEGDLGRIKQSLEVDHIKTCASMKSDLDMLSKQMVANQVKLNAELECFSKKTDTVWGTMEANMKQMATELQNLETRTVHCEKIVVDKSTTKESWADIVARVEDEVENKMIKVAQDVENKMKGVTVELTLLQKQNCDIQFDRDEQEEICKRKNSLIIHGLRESLSGNGSIRSSEDNDCVMDLLHQIKCPTVSVNTCIRLGKVPTDETQKPRPLKIVLSSEEQKDRVLRYAKNLKGMGNGLDKVFIHQDLTPKQRSHRQLLVKELKDRQQKGELNLMILRDKIVKRKLKPDAGTTILKTA